MSRHELTTPIADMLSGGPGWVRPSHDDQPTDEQSGHLLPAELADALALVEHELGHPLTSDERQRFLRAIAETTPAMPPAQPLADGGTVTLGAATTPSERIRQLLLAFGFGAAGLGVVLLLGWIAESLGQVLG